MEAKFSWRDGLYDIVTQFHDCHKTQPAWAKDNKAPTSFTLEDGHIGVGIKYQRAPSTPAHAYFDLGPLHQGTLA